MHKMFDFGVHRYTITIGNRRLFGVRMYNVQKELGIKYISDLVRKEIHGTFETKKPKDEQIKKYKVTGKEWFSDDIYTYYVCIDFI